MLVIDVLAILSMYAFGAYKDLSEKCTGFAGASSPCVEEYFYGYLYIAYIIGALLVSILVINQTKISSEGKNPRKK